MQSRLAEVEFTRASLKLDVQFEGQANRYCFNVAFYKHPSYEREFFYVS